MIEKLQTLTGDYAGLDDPRTPDLANDLLNGGQPGFYQQVGEFEEKIAQIGSHTPVVITTLDGASTTGWLSSVGRSYISIQETLGSGPVRSRRVLARHEVRMSAISRVTVLLDEG